jgi:hypothetical protein
MKALEEKLKEVHELLSEIFPHASEPSELVDRLSLEGSGFPGFSSWVESAFQIIENRDCFAVRVDEILIDDEELNRLRQRKNYIPKKWSFSLNKKAFLASFENSKSHLFFLIPDSFSNWLNSLNPFKWEGPDKVIISVGGIKNAFGGPGFRIIPPELIAGEDMEWPAPNLPDDLKVRRHVRVVPNEVRIRPGTFLATRLSGQTKLDEVLLRNSFLTLSAALAQEIFSPERVIIKGYRNAEVALLGEPEKPDLKEIELLQEAVEWVYEERTDTRMKLLADRLSLELTAKKSWYSVLAGHLKGAFRQAKEMYRFVILDRQDAYYRELRSLLGELKNQSKAYTAKIKSMTDGLFRDVLASLFLVAFGLFSKTDVTRIGELLDNPYLLFLLKGLAIYLVISYLFQLINNWNDLRISKSELQKWIETTRNYLSAQEVSNKIEEAVKERRRNYNRTVIIIGVAYFVIGAFCWFMGELF